MSRKTFTSLQMMAIFILITILTGCSSTTLKLGWSETSGLSHKSARYTTFRGIEQTKICTNAGGKISLEYKVTVEKGSLTVALNEPDGASQWQDTFNQDAADTRTLTAADKGCYTLLLTGDNTGGSFDIAWTISD